MTVVFNGIIEKSLKGCRACGQKKSTTQFVTRKSYILPSGITKTFFAKRKTEVSDLDGEWLLSLTYMQGGKEVHAFESDT